MPSPVGHMIAGVAAGWLVSGTPRGEAWKAHGVREALLFAALGALPDLDLLVGAHSGPTHSIGAAALVAAAALIVVRSRTLARWTIAMAACAAYGSHVLLDWLSTDSMPPIGVMALWPFSRTHYESELHIFMAISRRYYQGWTFVWLNVRAVLRELLILLPALGLIMLTRKRDAG
jgi:inner membrane protein